MYAMAAKGLNDYREDRYMNVNEFVDFLGISVNTFYSILRGKRPRFSTMKRIASKLEVTPADIEEFAKKANQESQP